MGDEKKEGAAESAEPEAGSLDAQYQKFHDAIVAEAAGPDPMPWNAWQKTSAEVAAAQFPEFR